MTGEIVLQVRNLCVTVPGRTGPINAVRGLDMDVRRGETLGIVGESGCGKSLSALALAGLLPDRVTISGGSIKLSGNDLEGLSARQWRSFHGRRIGMIFQEPMAALNPVLTIGEQVIEAILAHQQISVAEAREQANDLLERVMLPDPKGCMVAYPHQMSGGMRQRVLIAIAIANKPDVLIADEPTTALDATVQAEILSLLADLQRQTQMSLVIISHDLGLVSRWVDRVLVMYAGKAVENLPASELLREAAHPYTRALLAARPARRITGYRRPRLTEIPGRVPAPDALPNGCSFADRCSVALATCRSIAPEPVVSHQRKVWCHAPIHNSIIKETIDA